MTALLTSLPLYLSGLSSTLAIFFFSLPTSPSSLVAFAERNFQTLFSSSLQKMRLQKKSSVAMASCAAVILMYMYVILA